MRENLKEWEWYEAGRRFNNNIDPPQYDMVQANWDFYNGKQWVNSGAMDDLPKPVFNIINRIISFFVASLTSNAVKVSYSELAKQPLSDNPKVDIDVLNAAFSNFAERVELQDKVRELYQDGAITGDMALHAYFDYDRRPYDGKLSEVMGEICLETIKSTDIYLGNPNTTDIQSQPHVIIRGRATVQELQEEYNEYKNDEFNITSDSNDDEEDLIELDEVDSLGKATYILCYTKKPVKRKYTVVNEEGEEVEEEREEETVMVSKLVRDKYIYKNKDTGLDLYPVAFGNWESQRSIYHGRALCTSIIPNQIFINRMFAMAMQNLIMSAFPKLIYDKSRFSGTPSNRVGVAIGVENMGPGDNIANLMRYLEPGNMSGQVAQIIDMAMNFTKDMLGANDALLGSVNPEMASGAAITVAARQSGVPLENPKNNMYSLLEDLGRIYLDMVTTYYGERPVVVEGEEGTEIVMFDFEALNDIYLNTKVDVGATTYWNEIAMIQTLDNHLNAGRITFDQYLKRVPDDYIPDRQGLLNDMMAQMEAPPEAPPGEINIEEIVSQMSPEMQQQFMSLPPDQQEQLINEFMSQ